MSLPININDLINGLTVEWERIEFKAGWNPEKVIHSVCAFANDINNWGGGYIIIGIEEENGRPILPPKGLLADQIDAIQKRLLELCRMMTPDYSPVPYPTMFQGKQILILWVPGGDTRPYKVPVKIGEKSEKAFFVRRGSSSVRASNNDERYLYETAAKIPFDDRINHNASVEDLQLTHIQSFLKEVKSDLHKIANTVPFVELCMQMQIAKGPEEYTKPVNVGLLLFNDNPERFFRGARIEVVEYFDEVGDQFTEKTFTGPIHVQLKDALRYIKNIALKEMVRKIPGQAEALRMFNYPYGAIEEALVNAVYHRSYEDESPIEVNIRRDCIEILSYPGPIPPVDNKALQKTRIVARGYRNRRIGDFLKELHLTEGRGTGIPKIRKSMEQNGSPPPIFETDEDKNYFLTQLKINPWFLKAQTIAYEEAQETVHDRVQETPEEYVGSRNKLAGKLVGIEKEIAQACRIVALSRHEIAQALGRNEASGHLRRSIIKLIEQGILEYTIPESPRSKNQKYRLSKKGRLFI